MHMCVCVFALIYCLTYWKYKNEAPTDSSQYGNVFLKGDLAKNALFKGYASFSCLEYYQLHLRPKIRILSESAQCGHDIAICNFYLKCFVQKLQCICVPPSCTYQQYKYGSICTKQVYMDTNYVAVFVHTRIIRIMPRCTLDFNNNHLGLLILV